MGQLEPDEHLIQAITVELEVAGQFHTAQGRVLYVLAERIASKRVSAVALAGLQKAFADQYDRVFTKADDEVTDDIAELFLRGAGQ